MRYFLDFLGQSIELSPGETLLGRDLSCRIRFNDALVSRRHLRLCTSEGGVTVEDLGSANGTRLNGEPLGSPAPLRPGDEILLGQRCLRLRASVDGQAAAPAPAVADSLPLLATAGPEETTPRVSLEAMPARLREPVLGVHNCPRCRKLLAADMDRCPQCGHCFPPGRPGSVTIRLPPQSQGERRVEPRLPVDLPVVYTSETLSFEARALDISMGGVFIASELLESVGTPCQVALLPDGFPAFYFTAQVAHAISPAQPGTPRPGMGIRFMQMSPDGARWLADHVRRARRPFAAV